MNTLYAIIGLFAIGALVGLYLLALVLQNKETPKLVTLIHGTFVATALIMLIYYTMNTAPRPVEAVVLFILAAIGGVVVFYKDISRQPIPKWLAVGHGLIAITGFIFLLMYTFGS